MVLNLILGVLLGASVLYNVVTFVEVRHVHARNVELEQALLTELSVRQSERAAEQDHINTMLSDWPVTAPPTGPIQKLP